MCHPISFKEMSAKKFKLCFYVKVFEIMSEKMNTYRFFSILKKFHSFYKFYQDKQEGLFFYFNFIFVAKKMFKNINFFIVQFNFFNTYSY